MWSKRDEAGLNLEYALCLKDYFENFDFNVVLTRTNSNGLYGAFAKNKKKDDMLARKKIIENSNADVVLSIHMNSFATSSAKGCQAFYDKSSESGKQLAECVQQQLQKDMENAKSSAAEGDYYILNCTDTPSVLVECGFLSNPQEDQLICSEDYKSTLCYSIFCAIVTYFGIENI